MKKFKIYNKPYDFSKGIENENVLKIQREINKLKEMISVKESELYEIYENCDHEFYMTRQRKHTSL